MALETVPGSVFYDTSRRTILAQVDGIVFVVDTQRERIRQSVESLAELEESLLATTGRRLTDVPLVFQYNKRDLPGVVPVAELERTLNPDGAPSFEAVASSGQGVFDTLKACVRSVLAS